LISVVTLCRLPVFAPSRFSFPSPPSSNVVTSARSFFTEVGFRAVAFSRCLPLFFFRLSRLSAAKVSSLSLFSSSQMPPAVTFLVFRFERPRLAFLKRAGYRFHDLFGPAPTFPWPDFHVCFFSPCKSEDVKLRFLSDGASLSTLMAPASLLLRSPGCFELDIGTFRFFFSFWVSSFS